MHPRKHGNLHEINWKTKYRAMEYFLQKFNDPESFIKLCESRQMLRNTEKYFAKFVQGRRKSLISIFFALNKCRDVTEYLLPLNSVEAHTIFIVSYSIGSSETYRQALKFFFVLDSDLEMSIVCGMVRAMQNKEIPGI